MPINPTRSVSTASTPTGIYLGQIVAISNEIGRLDVMVRRLAGDAVFRGVDYVDSGFTTAPKVGEFVAVSFVEGRTEKIIVLGRLRSAVGDPEVDQTGAEEGSILLHDGARWSVGEVIGTVGKVDVTVDDGQIVLTLPPNVSITGDLFVSGDLTVTGTTTTVDAVTVDDPIITIGGESPLASDDNLDRGVQFSWHTGSAARSGFFGFDDSSGKFTFIPNATITGNVVSGTKGTLDANIEWTDVLNKPDPVVTVTLTGDVTGTANTTLTDLASGTVSVSTTIAANSVALGTDTTGNYVASLVAGTNVTLANNSGEGATPSITVSGTLTDINSISSPDFIQFDTTATEASTVGKLTWNDTDGTLDLGLKGGVSVLQLGQESLVRVLNNTGSTLANGQVVRVAGSQGQRLTVALATAASEAGSSKTLGVVTETIADGHSGFVTTEGLVRGLNTSALTEGSLIWLSTTAGGMTTTRPTAPNHGVLVGLCTHQSSGTSGSIFVKVQNGFELEELHDVSLTSPSSGQFLKYNGSLWVNDAIDLATDTVGDYIASITGTSNQVTVTGSGGESAAVTLSLPQSIATTSSPTFAAVTTTGVASVGGDLGVTGNITVTGNLTVNGTTTTVNSTTVTIDDPILTLGGDTAPTVDDNKDRGIEFRYYDTAARIGFFGYDDSSGKFAFLLNATNTSEVFSGTKAEIDATVDWSNIASKPDPVITVTLTGDVTGTANATLTDLASGTVSVATTITGNSVTLGTDTIGDYVATLSAGTGVSVSGSGTEGRAATVAIGQDVGTSATPTFGRLTLSQATGTAPMTVSSTTAVTNLNADLLDGQHGSWWVPTGAIMQYAMSTAPAGWLLCDGSPKLKADYPDLWALLGNTYGTSNTTQFYLPDLRGRVAVGLDNMGGTDADRLGVTNVLGGSGGVQTVTLADTQIPTHTHSNALGGTTTFATSGHSHYEGNLRAAIGAANGDAVTIAYVAESTSVVASGRGPSSVSSYIVSGASFYNGAFGPLAFNHHTRVYGQTDSVVSGGTATVTLTNGGTTGGGGSHDNMQPYLLTCYIIKT
jgi:microcystin-dependent protein